MQCSRCAHTRKGAHCYVNLVRGASCANCTKSKLSCSFVTAQKPKGAKGPWILREYLKDRSLHTRQPSDFSTLQLAAARWQMPGWWETLWSTRHQEHVDREAAEEEADGDDVAVVDTPPSKKSKKVVLVPATPQASSSRPSRLPASAATPTTPSRPAKKVTPRMTTGKGAPGKSSSGQTDLGQPEAGPSSSRKSRRSGVSIRRVTPETSKSSLVLSTAC